MPIRNPLRRLFSQGLLAALVLAAPAVHPQTSRSTLDATHQRPTASQIAEALRPKDTRKSGPNAPKENAYALVLTFSTGSSQLTSSDKVALQEFGKAFKEYIPGVPVTIEGHADPRGSDEFNKQLSEQRAKAVRDYLVDKLGNDPQQFEVIGFGKSRLKNTQNPVAEINRRVEFVTKND